MTDQTTRTHRLYVLAEHDLYAEADRIRASKGCSQEEALHMARLHLAARQAVEALPSLRKVLDDDGGPLSGQQP